jgi:hypothetical protein
MFNLFFISLHYITLLIEFENIENVKYFYSGNTELRSMVGLCHHWYIQSVFSSWVLGSMCVSSLHVLLPSYDLDMTDSGGHTNPRRQGEKYCREKWYVCTLL